MVSGILGRRSPQTARHAHNVLRAALGQAERWELVPRNVARLVKAPRVALAQVPTIEPTDVRRFLDSLPRGTYGALFTLAVSTGLRQGELLALTWPDVDTDRGIVRVRATLRPIRHTRGEDYAWDEPKTPRSVRDVPLTGRALAVMRRHKAAALSASLVFARPDGRPLDRREANYRWRAALVAVGLPPVRMHSARHWFAGLSLDANGGDLRAVQALLGHESITTTVNRYGGLADAAKQRTVDALGDVLGRDAG